MEGLGRSGADRDLAPGSRQGVTRPSNNEPSEVSIVTWLRPDSRMASAWGSPDFVDTDQGFTGVSVRAAMNACS